MNRPLPNAKVVAVVISDSRKSLSSESASDAGMDSATPLSPDTVEETGTIRAAPSEVRSAPLADLAPHPLAVIIPGMPPDEYADLVADIRANGLKQPITLYEGMILDGRHRRNACVELGITPVFVEFTGTADQARACVLSLNLHRRHLSREQKRDSIAAMLKATPEKSNRQIGEILKADHKLVANVRGDLQATGEIPQLKKTTGKDGRARPVRLPKPTAKATPKPVILIINDTEPATPKVSTRDIIAEIKTAVTTRLADLTVEERADIARRLVAHLKLAYLPRDDDVFVRFPGSCSPRNIAKAISKRLDSLANNHDGGITRGVAQHLIESADELRDKEAQRLANVQVEQRKDGAPK